LIDCIFSEIGAMQSTPKGVDVGVGMGMRADVGEFQLAVVAVVVA
jgi:hypothetical protein